MKRNKKNVLNSQYLINYDEFDELNETPNILNGTVKRDCVGRIPADCIRISTHHTDNYMMSRIDFSQDICEIIARKHFQYAKISVDPQTKLAIIVLNKVGGQCNIIQRSDSIRCSGCNINSKDLVTSADTREPMSATFWTSSSTRATSKTKNRLTLCSYYHNF